jgi:hypothetical protein
MQMNYKQLWKKREKTWIIMNIYISHLYGKYNYVTTYCKGSQWPQIIMMIKKKSITAILCMACHVSEIYRI